MDAATHKNMQKALFYYATRTMFGCSCCDGSGERNLRLAPDELEDVATSAIAFNTDQLKQVTPIDSVLVAKKVVFEETKDERAIVESEDEHHDQQREEHDDDPDDVFAKPVEVDTSAAATSVPLTRHASYMITETQLEDVKSVLKSKTGWKVKKHCRDGHARARTLHLTEDERAITWHRTKTIKLSDVVEVRHGTTIDPTTVGLPKRPKGMAGTETLRKCADGSKVARRAFSLILSDRTFDFECDTVEEASKFCSAFQKLVEQAHKTD